MFILSFSSKIFITEPKRYPHYTRQHNLIQRVKTVFLQRPKYFKFKPIFV